jgi:CheY-like chemotaxis protein
VIIIIKNREFNSSFSTSLSISWYFCVGQWGRKLDLSSLQLACHPFRSGGAALAAIQQRRSDALVVDIGTLGEDGYALIRQIRTLESEQGRQTPAIALTTRDVERTQSLREGFHVHIAEPFEPVELIAALASLTSRLH